MYMRVRILVLAALLASAVATGAQAPAQGQAATAAQPNGATIFDSACATCHTSGVGPAVDTLRSFSPEAVVNALVNGKMAAQGAALSDAERRAVAQFLTGRAPAATPAVASTGTAGRCTTAIPTTDPARGPSWMAWGGDLASTRHAPNGGVTAADLPRLTLKWAFGYQGVSAARAQPALAGDKLFVASENAEVHALNPKTGCTRQESSSAASPTFS
jgi:polyvinyl alcohol dehydrogenase (cytochrome)